MDYSRSGSGAGEDNIGIPDDLRCKRSDGKQWRCTALSMPDKTVCEKHYIQAKKRAANSAAKASMKKKRKSIGDGDDDDDDDVYLESKNDDVDFPLINPKTGDFYSPASGKKYKENVSKSQISYSPEEPSGRSLSLRSSLKSKDDLQRDGNVHEESKKSYRTPPPSGKDSSRSRPHKVMDASHTTETTEGSSDSSDDTGGQPCHQCRRNDRVTVVWCLKCNRRGYCDVCISTWYSDMPLEEIEKVCPACRGSCSCKVCLRGDNLIKARIREIPAQDKLQYLYSLLSSVLPVVHQIHREHCTEVEMEKRFRGNNIDLARTKLNADEQMCCNFCRIPIIDYHRHCPDCSYDLCLSCCKDVREASLRNQTSGEGDDKETVSEQVELSNVQLTSLRRNSDWRANSDGSIPCPPKEYGGCNCSVLTLKRIFKMSWVAKLLKNVEEMVGGCRVSDPGSKEKAGSDQRLFQAAHRENDSDNYLYHPFSQNIRTEGIEDFRIHWSKGHPVLVKEVCDTSSMTIWDPMTIWRGIRETAEERLKDGNRIVKAIDCFSCTEVDIELDQFITGYSEGRIHEDGRPEILKLKDWPSPSVSEEFLMYQRPDFISKLPLLEFIHSKWGLLNVAAKLPHYSLQNDVGPKILISYGTSEELGMGASVDNLHLNMRDMVFLLVHICEVKQKGSLKTNIEKTQKANAESQGREFLSDPEISISEGSPRSMTSEQGRQQEDQNSDLKNDEKMADCGNESSSSSEKANLDVKSDEKMTDRGNESSHGSEKTDLDVKNDEKMADQVNESSPCSEKANLDVKNDDEMADRGNESSSSSEKANLDVKNDEKMADQGNESSSGSEKANLDVKNDDKMADRGNESSSSSEKANLDVKNDEKMADQGNESSSSSEKANLDVKNDEKMADQDNEYSSSSEKETFNCQDLNGAGDESSGSSPAGAFWDVFRREDVQKLNEFLRREFNLSDSHSVKNGSVLHPLYNGTIYLHRHQISRLKEEFGVEPWSFKQHLGEAVFIPAGCPFQVRNVQSTVKLGLDFLSPESLIEGNRLSEEIRGLPNDHEAKLQILEVGKISLYAASWAIKEVQKLVLDPKLGSELGYEDPNLTALVSDNLEKMVKRRQITCV